MSEAIFNLKATVRTVKGKGASRRLRRQASALPGIIYGAEKEPVMIELNQHEVRKAISHEAFFAHILTLDVDGKSEKVIVKDIQRHPYKIELVHMDFQRIDPKHAVHMVVPIHCLNEDKAPGLKRGGVISHNITEVEIKCLPSHLPEFLEVDAATLDLDHIIHLSDIKCPKGVEIVALSHADDQDLPVVTMYIPRAEIEPEVEEAPAEEAAPEASEDKDSE